MIFSRRTAPTIGRAIAATSTKTARTLNVVGVWETAAENQSNTASKRRMATAPQTPGPTIKPRTSTVSFSGRTTPYNEIAMSIVEKMASVMAI